MGRIKVKHFLKSFLKPYSHFVFLQLPGPPSNSLTVLRYFDLLSFVYVNYHRPILQFPEYCGHVVEKLSVIFTNQHKVNFSFASTYTVCYFPLLLLLKPCV